MRAGSIRSSLLGPEHFFSPLRTRSFIESCGDVATRTAPVSYRGGSVHDRLCATVYLSGNPTPTRTVQLLLKLSVGLVVEAEMSLKPL
jgi:hypothetical protein